MAVAQARVPAASSRVLLELETCPHQSPTPRFQSDTVIPNKPSVLPESSRDGVACLTCPRQDGRHCKQRLLPSSFPPALRALGRSTGRARGAPEQGAWARGRWVPARPLVFLFLRPSFRV